MELLNYSFTVTVLSDIKQAARGCGVYYPFDGRVGLDL